MKIGEISPEEVWAGRNWRFCPPEGDDWLDQPMEEWEGAVVADAFSEEDDVIYSGLSVTPSGQATPLLLLKTVGDAGYGGDYCEFVGGSWRQVGLDPDPDAPMEQEYIANPLPNDPSFDAPDHDYRKWHRQGFRKHARVQTGRE